MANSLLLDIVIFLENNNVIEGDGKDTFRDFIPESPDYLVAVTEYKGSPVVPYEPAVHRSVQISVRHVDADEARRKAWKIYKTFLDNKQEDSRVDFTENRWGQVSFRQPPFRVSTDKSDRVTYAFNLGITTSIE